MNRHRIKIIAGWGYRGKDMATLGEHLSPYGDVDLTSVAELGRSGGDPSYAAAFRDEITEPCVLVGWSTGAMVILEAVACLGVPASHIVLISGTSRFCTDKEYNSGVSIRNLSALNVGLRRAPKMALRLFLTQVGFPRKVNVKEIKERADDMLSVGMDVLNEGLVYLSKFDVRKELESVTVPVLVVHGRQDKIVPWQAGEYVSAGVACSKLCVHDDEGHRIPVDSPELVTKDIAEFLEEHE